MQYCPRCKITVRGNKACCPLCQGQLEGEPSEAPFPVLKPPAVSSLTLFRICTFAAVLAELALGFVWVATDLSGGWISLTMILTALVWADIWVALYLRDNFLKMLTVQFYLAMILLPVIDYRTGFHGWSFTWAIPGTFAAMAVMLMAAGFLPQPSQGVWTIYIFFETLVSLLQLIPIRYGWNWFRIPALASIAGLIALSAWILIFHTKAVRHAFAKWGNL